MTPALHPGARPGKEEGCTARTPAAHRYDSKNHCRAVAHLPQAIRAATPPVLLARVQVLWTTAPGQTLPAKLQRSIGAAWMRGAA